jgi:hypothetical protein
MTSQQTGSISVAWKHETASTVSCTSDCASKPIQFEHWNAFNHMWGFVCGGIFHAGDLKTFCTAALKILRGTRVCQRMPYTFDMYVLACLLN